MKKRNWISLTALALLVSFSLSSCYYGSYGPPRPYRGGGGHHHHHGGGHGHHGGYR